MAARPSRRLRNIQRIPADATASLPPTAEQIADAALQRCAAEVRACYLEALEAHNAAVTGGAAISPRSLVQWDGGVDATNRRHRPIWPKIAQFLADNGVTSVPAFIDANFRTLRPPRPNQLMRPEALQLFAAWWKDKEQAIAAALPTEIRKFRMADADVERWFPQMTKVERWAYVLHGSPFSLSPLFRYCVGVSSGFDVSADVIASLRDDALREFHTYRDLYLRHWADILPSELLQEPAEQVTP